MTGYEKIKDIIDKKAATDPKFRSIIKRIENGTATFIDTAEYSEIVSDIFGRSLSANVLSLSEREAVCTALLKDRYNDINSVLAQVQRSLDEKMGLHLAPQKAAFPAERVAQIAHSLVDPTVPDETITRRANSAANVSMSFHDDYIRENAKFRNDAGLKCYIVRMGTNCCTWCSDVAGKYRFGDQLPDIFRRHDNCDCTIIYDNQVLRGQIGEKGRTKTWEQVGTVPVEYHPTVFTQEQAKALEQRNLQYRGLTNSRSNGIINAISIQDIQTADANGIISNDCRETIVNTIQRMKKEGTYFAFDDIRIVDIPHNRNGSIDVLRTNAIDRAGNPYIVLEINSSAFTGRNRVEIDRMFLGAQNTVCNSLEDAVIHEVGHARTIYDRSYANYERINEELGDIFTAPLKDRADKKSLRDLAAKVSELAQKDGLECIAECGVKLSRGEPIPAELKEFYDKYTNGGG